MGSITAYEIGSGRRYRVRWRDDQQKQIEKKGFRTKKEAELYLAHTAVSRSNGSYTDPGEARITVGALGVEWLRDKKHALKASSFSSLEGKHLRARRPRRSFLRLCAESLRAICRRCGLA